MVCKKGKERYDPDLDWEPGKSAVPGQDREDQDRAGKSCRESKASKSLFEAWPDR